MPHETMIVERDGPVLKVTLNRPEVRNALSPEMVSELVEAFEQARDDAQVRVVVLMGAGGNFCAGGDLKGMKERGASADAGSAASIAASNRRFGALLETIDALPKAVIALIEGATMGGGVGLLAVSDWAIAEQAAQIGTPEVTVGLVPAQITPFVANRVGYTHARRMATFGLRLDAREALRIGLVHELADGHGELVQKGTAAVNQCLRCCARGGCPDQALGACLYARAAGVHARWGGSDLRRGPGRRCPRGYPGLHREAQTGMAGEDRAAVMGGGGGGTSPPSWSPTAARSRAGLCARPRGWDIAPPRSTRRPTPTLGTCTWRTWRPLSVRPKRKRATSTSRRSYPRPSGSGRRRCIQGYGFLSENADFARACAEAGVVFIGPSASAIEAMGDKAEAKRRMAKAGVPCVPGYQGADQTDATLAREAERIGFPIMVKAAAGGGGRGMRLVEDRSDLAAALARARAEAESAFGSGDLILERFLPHARHVEVQVLADAIGRVIHLGERDCSVQRRHQKVIEETPSPAVSPELRARMVAAATAAARAIGYTNAGTVEFLLDGDGAFYFLEMNTRLQVEHPVTEMVTGLDLVELQIRIARGEPLAMRQEDVRFAGHAIEARLYAEAPHQGFLPQSGRLVTWRPPAGAGIRVDHGLAEGQEISPHYDPLLAKIIAHGDTREEARRRLIRAVQDTVALGLATNRGFLVDCLGHDAFAGGGATTQFVPATFAKVPPPRADADAQALAAALWFEASATRQGHDPARAWTSAGPIAWPLRLETSAGAADMTVCVLGPRHYQISDGRHVTELQLASDSETGLARVRRGGKERARGLRLRWRDAASQSRRCRPRRGRDAVRAASVRRGGAGQRRVHRTRAHERESRGDTGGRGRKGREGSAARSGRSHEDAARADGRLREPSPALPSRLGTRWRPGSCWSS